MPPKLFAAIMAFVVNRKYVLKVGDYLGDSATVATSGVPQGSHMGPLLFIFYIADMLKLPEIAEIFVRLFADDTKFMKAINCPDDALKLHTAINALVKWSVENKLPLNEGKTKFVSFYATRSRRVHTSYFVSNDTVTRMLNQVDLGIIFDERMTFVQQFEKIIAKSRQMYSVAGRFSREAKCNSLIGVMFKTYILPIIELNSTIWAWDNAGLSIRLEKIQRDCTRAILRTASRPSSACYVSYLERLRRLSWIKLEDRRKISALANLTRFFSDERTNPIRTILMNCYFDGVSKLRVQRPFINIKAHTTITSIAGRLMLLACDLQENFSVDLPLVENKRNLTEYFLESYAQ